jgi:hypothetical protein
MRFCLRTLMIVVTLLCAYSAWVAHAKRRKEFHVNQANQIARQIGVVEAAERENIDQAITLLTTPGTNSWTTSRNGTTRVLVENSGSVQEICIPRTIGEDSWTRLAHHKLSADAYGRAMFQPRNILFGPLDR